MIGKATPLTASSWTGTAGNEDSARPQLPPVLARMEALALEELRAALHSRTPAPGGADPLEVCLGWDLARGLDVAAADAAPLGDGPGSNPDGLPADGG